MAQNQIIGGNFQDSLGNQLSKGYLIFELSQDAQSSTTNQIVAGYKVQVNLDSTGNVPNAANVELWPNDLILPANTFYLVSAYSSAGQLVWGPNAQQVLSTPSPFNLGSWVPATVNTLPPTGVVLSAVTLAGSATAGSATLPAAPISFLPVTINGTLYKIALYSA